MRSDPGIGSSLDGFDRFGSQGGAAAHARRQPGRRVIRAEKSSMRLLRMLLTPICRHTLVCGLWTSRKAGTAPGSRTGSRSPTRRAPPRMTTAIGCRISRPAMSPKTSDRQEAAPIAASARQDRPEPLARPAQDQLRTERLALLRSRRWKRSNRQDAVARRHAQHREASGKRAEEHGAARPATAQARRPASAANRLRKNRAAKRQLWKQACRSR